MHQFAIGWLVVELAVAEGTPERAPFYLGLTGLARLVPTVIVGLVAGVAVDAIDPARILVLTQACLSAVALVTAWLTYGDSISIPIVLAATVVLGAAFAFDTPARLSLAQVIVEPRDAFGALGIIRVTRQVASIAAPILAGFLIVWLGIAAVLAFDAALFAVASLGLARLTGLSVQTRGERVAPLRSFREGLAYVASEPTLWGLMAVNVVVNAFAWSFAQLLPAVTHDSFRAGALELSWLTSATGAGAVLGSLGVILFGRGVGFGRAMVGALFLAGAALVAFGLQRSVGPSIALALLVGTGMMAYFSGSSTFVQLAAPRAMRGRVIALLSTIGNGSTQAGILLLGSLGAVIGISNALLLGGIVILATAVVVVRVPAIRDLNIATPGRREDGVIPDAAP